MHVEMWHHPLPAGVVIRWAEKLDDGEVAQPQVFHESGVLASSNSSSRPHGDIEPNTSDMARYV